MKRFVEGTDRGQSTLFPECLEDWIHEDNPVRVIDVFVDELDLGQLGFDGVDPEATGRPSYHPSILLKLYIYGYLNRVQSSRRLEHEAGRNVEVGGKADMHRRHLATTPADTMRRKRSENTRQASQTRGQRALSEPQAAPLARPGRPERWAKVHGCLRRSGAAIV